MAFDHAPSIDVRLRPVLDAIALGDWLGARQALLDEPGGAVGVSLGQALDAVQLVYQGRHTEALPALLVAIPPLEQTSIADRIDWLYAATGYALGMIGDPLRGLEWSQRALDLAEANGLAAARRRALSTHGTLLALAGDHGGAWVVLHEVLEIAEFEQDERAIAIASGNLAFCAVDEARGLPEGEPRRGSLAERALAMAEITERRARQAGLAIYQGFAATSQGTALELLARAPEAVAVLREAVSLTASNPPMQADALLALTRASRGVGDLEGARAALARVESLVADGDLQSAAARLLDEGLALALALDRRDDALAWAQRAIAHWRGRHAARDAMLLQNRRLFGELDRQRRELSELRQATKGLQEAAMRDPLTALFNRRGLAEWLAQATTDRWCLAALDIDHFKRINDGFGHATGDAVLVQLATLLRDHCRRDDLVVRLGGEEFLVIYAHASLNAAAASAERLRDTVASHDWSALQAELTVCVSVGLALRASPLESFEAALARADRALYDAKRTGRNRVCVAEPGSLVAT